MKTTSHWLLVLNGKSAGRADVRAAIAGMRAQGIELDVRVTWEHGDAARHAEEAIARGIDTLIAGGGDGTVNEVVNALMASGHREHELPTLAILPLGTANDFATSAGIPWPPAEALALIAKTAPQPVDVLRVEGDDQTRWCINVATGGFGTQVTVETDPELKRRLGGLAYFLTGLGKLGKAEAMTARLSAGDFRWQGEFIALGIGNGRQAGGGRELCPTALIDDGLIDFTIVPPPPEGSQGFSDVMSALGTAMSAGRAAALAQVATCGRHDQLVVESDHRFTLNLDGEPFAARRFHIQCVPATLALRLPSASALLAGNAAAANA
ncbi:MAG: lipid kinase YegS [Pseudomonadota bacterium]|nr:lipid kinase YegS [Pseudomonadota bacterium]